MTGHRRSAHRQLGLSLAVGLATSAAFSVWAWAQQPPAQPPARAPVGLPPRTEKGSRARAKGLSPAGLRPHRRLEAGQRHRFPGQPDRRDRPANSHPGSPR